MTKYPVHLPIPALFAFVCLATTLASAVVTAAAEQEYYELRVYKNTDAAKQQVVSDYLEQALVPALNRLGVERVGVFTRTDDDDDKSVYVLIPFASLDAFVGHRAKLASDAEYQKGAASFLAIPKKQAPYLRIESKLMRAFAGMPVVELPEESKTGQPRLFELRTYESHNEAKARLKVEMFNQGEIQVMRDVKLAPVFYGETLIGHDVPNLTYMLSAPNQEAHDQHWAGFRSNPDWNRMKGLERYKGTVSKITKWMLAPTDYSQI